MSDLVGKTLADQYHIVDKLGEGGMASVYKAQDWVRNCTVAIKVMKKWGDDEACRKRFRLEAESLVNLEHPHIVRFYELVERADPPFMVIEYIEGQSLEQRMAKRQRKPLPLCEAIRIVYEIGTALNYAHHEQVYHRDIKPSNVLLDHNNKTYLVDFGVALLAGHSRLTTSGQVIGTLDHAAPEQLGKGQVDARTDVYALGVLLYELLTGHPPFFTKDYKVLVQRIRYERPIPPSQKNSQVPHKVEGIILKALEKEKQHRYPNVARMLNELVVAGEMEDTLEPLREENPPAQETQVDRPGLSSKKHPLFTWGFGLSLVLLTIASWLILSRPNTLRLIWQPTATSTGLALAHNTVLLTSPTLVDTATPVPPTPSPTPTHTSTPTPTALPTSTLSPTPTSTVSPTPSPVPYLTVDDDQSDVYGGPGANYRVLGQVRRGDRLPILGCSEDRGWWQVDYLGWPGWVAVQAVTTDANIQAFPTVETPSPPTNHAPIIQWIHPAPATVQAGNAITMTCQASDPDGDALIYVWEASDGLITGQDALIRYQAPEVVGIQTVTVTVQDGYGGEAKQSIQVQVTLAQPPVGKFEPIGIFGQIWHDNAETRRKLGWATREEIKTFGAQQLFQEGIMFWRQDLYLVYVLMRDGNYQIYESDWNESMDEYSCSTNAPRTTPPIPKRHIGKVWCEQLGGPDSAIGWASLSEKDYYARWQSFEHGLMWQGNDEYIYVFYDDGSWQSYPNQ